MAETLRIDPVTTGMECPKASGLVIREREHLNLWSVQANRKHDLCELAQALFDAELQAPMMLTRDSMQLIHLGPHRALLMNDQPVLPESCSSFKSMLTDISHGHCELGLSGPRAFEFINRYCSVDLADNAGSLRCRFGQYTLLLWWHSSSDIRILIDRSMAQSFRDYLEHLMHRWNWTA